MSARYVPLKLLSAKDAKIGHATTFTMAGLITDYITNTFRTN